MASLRKKERSPYWFACFTLPNGRRVQRSTQETKRKDAQRKADQWESLSKERAKAKQAHRVISDIYKAAHNEELPNSTAKAFIEGWLTRRKGEIAPASYASYSGRARHFIAWLGDAALRPLTELETRQIVTYRDAVSAQRSTTTANHAVKILRIIFEDARRDGFIGENPAKDCGLLKKAAGTTRQPFTVDQIRQILEIACDEWRSLILFGIYTGQRLGDLARLTWSSVDLASNEIQLTTSKTTRVVRIPICDPLRKHIDTLPAGDDARAPIHPKASALAAVNVSRLSKQFGELLATCGLAESYSRNSSEETKGSKRAKFELSFHSLRHTATSLMKNAGISPAIVQDIIGHDSAEMSAHYTHIETAAKRKAVASLPDFVQPAKTSI